MPPGSTEADRLQLLAKQPFHQRWLFFQADLFVVDRGGIGRAADSTLAGT